MHGIAKLPNQTPRLTDAGSVGATLPPESTSGTPGAADRNGFVAGVVEDVDVEGLTDMVAGEVLDIGVDGELVGARLPPLPRA